MRVSVPKPLAGRAQAIKRLSSLNKTTKIAAICGLWWTMTMSVTTVDAQQRVDDIDERVAALLAEMTIAEKIGQMTQLNASSDNAVEYLGERLRSGRLGSVLNLADAGVINELQRIAVEESRLGIPLLVGRDVIHGFATVMPLPIGQAASFNPEVARDGARIAALEAAGKGINWTFAPMIDVSRDPRWGRIAESYGEDPYLTAVMGAATIEGFQGDDLAAETAFIERDRFGLEGTGLQTDDIEAMLACDRLQGGEDFLCDALSPAGRRHEHALDFADFVAKWAKHAAAFSLTVQPGDHHDAFRGFARIDRVLAGRRIEPVAGLACGLEEGSGLGVIGADLLDHDFHERSSLDGKAHGA